MAQFYSPKLLIVDYYDSLINRIDIYTEELLAEYSEDDVLPKESEPSASHWWIALKLKETIDNPYKIDYNGVLNIDNQVKDVVPGLTKVHDYLNRVRSKAIEEIGKVRDENLSRYELNKEKFKKYGNRDELTEEKIEEMRRELFEESFCFLLSVDRVKNSRSNCLFELHTIVTDCYFDSNDQEIISSDIREKPLVYLDDIYRSMLSKYISDLLYFKLENSDHQRKYGNEVIRFTKEHFYKIEHISIGPQTTPRLGYEEFDFDLPSQSGFTLTHLKSIEIIREILNAKCEIKNIERLKNLEYISIENLKISDKLKDELSGLSKLVGLTLNKCGVTMKLSGGVFRPPSNLSVLQVINLNYPIDFESARKLETLYLNGVRDYNHLLNLNSSIDLHIWKNDVFELDKRESFLKDHNFSKVTLF